MTVAPSVPLAGFDGATMAEAAGAGEIAFCGAGRRMAGAARGATATGSGGGGAGSASAEAGMLVPAAGSGGTGGAGRAAAAGTAATTTGGGRTVRSVGDAADTGTPTQMATTTTACTPVARRDQRGGPTAVTWA